MRNTMSWKHNGKNKKQWTHNYGKNWDSTRLVSKRFSEFMNTDDNTDAEIENEWVY